jgi:hypothetical protein
MPTLRQYKMQLSDLRTGKAIIASGGMFQVCSEGSPDKVTLYDVNGGVIANPKALSMGMVDFYVDASLNGVDVVGIGPNGHWFEAHSIDASGNNEIWVDQATRHGLYRIPYSHADSTDAVEKDTGFDLPAGAIIDPDVGIVVGNIDATETMDVGILSSESSGDADGFMNDIPISTAGTLLAKSAATATRGALVGGGTLDRGHVVVSGSQSVSYTTTAGTDSGDGWILLPYYLPQHFV